MFCVFVFFVVCVCARTRVDVCVSLYAKARDRGRDGDKKGGTTRKEICTDLALRAQIQEHGYGRFESCVHKSEGLLPTPSLT